jgi:hypothetical protein
MLLKTNLIQGNEAWKVFIVNNAINIAVIAQNKASS